MKKKDLIYFLALNMVENTKAQTMNELLQRFKDIEDLFRFDYSLKKTSVAENNVINKLKSNKEYYLEKAEKELDIIEKDGSLKVITIRNREYPTLLKNIFDPPPVLYIRGKIPEMPPVAMVGSRMASQYGIRMAFNLSKELAENGIAVISGMAVGIDAFSHKGALAGNGKTVAVLGSGLFHIYPDENRGLYDHIVDNGAVISEFSLTQKPEKYNFPRRNRIVSGMSLGTIVVEAGERSGALITASCALDQGRDVFAVPGNVTDPHFFGTNKLIKEGAKLVSNVDDILNELKIELKHIKKKIEVKKDKKQKKDELTLDEKRVLDLLDDKSQSVDNLKSKIRISVSELERILMVLEIKGYANQIPGHKFRRVD
ncbi:MAG: DNA-processing protein DprA [Spirochaetes bacterium]|nr:DNA-processing protein DprA [Spirochaetota bacterium]